jgi:quinohemoprotein ethanol dehydrogenase
MKNALRAMPLARLALAAAGTATADAGRMAGAVDAARLRTADRQPRNWMEVGRGYTEDHYSPLNQIGAATIGRLGLAWAFDLDTGRGPRLSRNAMSCPVSSYCGSSG